MSTTIEALYIPRGWSKAYIHQIAEYIRSRDIDGYYYGNKEQFEKRHKAILEWIEGYELYCDYYSVKFKNKPKDKQ